MEYVKDFVEPWGQRDTHYTNTEANKHEVTVFIQFLSCVGALFLLHLGRKKHVPAHGAMKALKQLCVDISKG